MTRKEAFNMLDQMARGIAEMFGSNCETIIHDLEDPHHPILALYNGHVSGRTVGSTQDLPGAERDLYLDDDVERTADQKFYLFHQRRRLSLRFWHKL